jgi:NAD-dependent DNA ligase
MSSTILSKLRKDTITTLSTLGIDDIEKIVQQANKAYYTTDSPLFSDETYDTIIDYLATVYPNSKQLAQVGAPVVTRSKVTLPFFMGSMDKIKNDDKALTVFKTTYKGNYILTDKLDGVSAMLHHDGHNLYMYTRGDGQVGQNITSIMKYIKGIPKVNLSNVTIRGELIISKIDFEKVKDKGANARNMVSGLVNAKTPDLSLLQHVQFVPYSVYQPVLKQSEQFKMMNKMGFNTVYNQKLDGNMLNVDTLSALLMERKDCSAFELDGIIVTHDEVYPIKASGNPVHAFAFKSIVAQEVAKVTVTNVEWNTSKDGYAIPVVLFEPVKLSGVLIQRASGFNAEFINKNNIGVGSQITVTRSGDVIPYIVNVLTPSSTGKASLPTCAYTWTSSGKDIIIQGDSKDQQCKVLENFFTKMSIERIRAGTITRLHNVGLHTIGDILRATANDFAKADGITKQTAVKMVDSIKDGMKNANIVTLMAASNMFGRGFGEKRIKLIIDTYPHLAHSKVISKEELTKIHGISETLASEFISGLEKFHQFIKVEHLEQYTCYEVKQSTSKNTSLSGQVIVFTGFRDKELEQKIITNGGIVVTSISKKTTIVVSKDPQSTSGKVQQAREQGIKIMSADDITKYID